MLDKIVFGGVILLCWANGCGTRHETSKRDWNVGFHMNCYFCKRNIAPTITRSGLTFGYCHFCETYDGSNSQRRVICIASNDTEAEYYALFPLDVFRITYDIAAGNTRIIDYSTGKTIMHLNDFLLLPGNAITKLKNLFGFSMIKCYFCKRMIINNQDDDDCCLYCQNTYGLGQVITFPGFLAHIYTHRFDKSGLFGTNAPVFHIRLRLKDNITEIVDPYSSIYEENILCELEGFPITPANVKQKLKTLLVFK